MLAAIRQAFTASFAILFLGCSRILSTSYDYFNKSTYRLIQLYLFFIYFCMKKTKNRENRIFRLAIHVHFLRFRLLACDFVCFFRSRLGVIIAC